MDFIGRWEDIPNKMRYAQRSPPGEVAAKFQIACGDPEDRTVIHFTSIFELLKKLTFIFVVVAEKVQGSIRFGVAVPIKCGCSSPGFS